MRYRASLDWRFPIALLLAAFLPAAACAQEAVSRILLVPLEDQIIHPVTERFLLRAVRQAHEGRVQCMIIQLDTPGGLHGFDLARVVAFADIILMPVCNSAFDRESGAACHAELMALPRVASGRCKVAAVGMRLDARTRAAETLAAWAAGMKLPFVAALREAQVYVRGVERGLTLFDQPAEKVEADLAQWKPLVDWLEPILAVVHRPAIRRNPAVVRPPLPVTSNVASLPRLRPAVVAEPTRSSAGNRLAGWFGWLTPPRFRQRPS